MNAISNAISSAVSKAIAQNSESSTGDEVEPAVRLTRLVWHEGCYTDVDVYEPPFVILEERNEDGNWVETNIDDSLDETDDETDAAAYTAAEDHVLNIAGVERDELVEIVTPW